jgi:hypothetical protein
MTMNAVDLVSIPLALVGMGYLVELCRKRFASSAGRRHEPRADTNDATPADVLQANVSALMSALQTDLAQLQLVAPAFSSLMTETALSVLVIEYVLREKGLIEGPDMRDALHLARGMATADTHLGAVQVAGHA